MKKFVLLAASALLLTTFIPEAADAQVRVRPGVRAGVGPRVAVRPGVRYGVRPGYGYRRGPGIGPAIGLGVLGAAALGAAAVSGYGYVDPCLRQQEVLDPYGYPVVQTFRVC
jgi:hypothetical protein